ncbi:MAG: glycosyltransferase family 2 protein [Candidatus Marinimicrobia bacterium]|nr:glycosyltransferase family 2 protein [Candidatus Neomarinimicrobiota bacterium]
MTALPDSLPLVSLITPVYNAGPHYTTCFESLCRLAYPPELLEVLVIDDCSTDGTREFLRRQKPPDFIHRLYPEKNLGRSGARNLGLERAGGSVVIFLDGDMEVQPDFIHHHVEELSRPGREAVIGRVDPAPWLPKSKLNRYLYDYPRRGARQFGMGTPIGFNYMISGNVALSREAADAGGLFDENFTQYGGEDSLFAYRVARQFPNGIFYSDHPRAWHHHHHRLRPYLARLTGYGRHNLPQLISRHPEIATPLAADFAWPLAGSYFFRKRLLGRLVFNPFTRALAWLGWGVLPYPASNYPVRFLIVASVIAGLRRYLRGHQPSAHSEQ